MYRIDGPGHVNNQFTEGNPNIGQQATKVAAAWLNAVQEEIAFTIEEAGIALDKENSHQLYAALVALIAGVVGDGDGAAPTTRQILTAGLATGGGDLAADRTITVPKASAAEVAVGTNDTKAVTPLALMGGAGARNLASTGYASIMGIMFQWGTCAIGPHATATIAFPVAFPATCGCCVFSGGYQLIAAEDNNPFVSNVSATHFTLFNPEVIYITGRFFAIGF